MAEIKKNENLMRSFFYAKSVLYTKTERHKHIRGIDKIILSSYPM